MSGGDVIQNEIRVAVRGNTYTFRMPSIQYEAEVGYRTNDLLAQAVPEGTTQQATMMGPGANAYGIMWSRAVMELYLIRATDEWPFTGGPGVVKSALFPLNRSRTVEAIGGAFQAEMVRFLDDGTADAKPPGAEAVAGQPNPG